MRLWSLHPKCLDQKGLVALWREGLLAQKVLLGETRGYKRHPQLLRFINTSNPVGAIGSYLYEVYKESQDRGFQFNNQKINEKRIIRRMKVTRGQIEFELDHLKRKLKHRDRIKYKEIALIKQPECNPVFEVTAGDIESWEKGTEK